MSSGTLYLQKSKTATLLAVKKRLRDNFAVASSGALPSSPTSNNRNNYGSSERNNAVVPSLIGSGNTPKANNSTPIYSAHNNNNIPNVSGGSTTPTSGGRSSRSAGVNRPSSSSSNRAGSRSLTPALFVGNFNRDVYDYVVSNTELQAKLEVAYRGLCTYGYTLYSEGINFESFKQFLAESKILSQSAALDEHFMSGLLTAVKADQSGHLFFEQFISVVYELAKAKYGNKYENKGLDAFVAFLEEFIFSNEDVMRGDADFFIPMVDFTEDRDIEALFFAYFKALLRMFELHGITLKQINPLVSADTLLYNYGIPMPPLRTKKVMRMSEFETFLKAVRIYPGLISNLEATKIFNFVEPQGDGYNAFITYDQFTDCLGNLALLLYSKSPHNTKYPTYHDKIRALLDSFALPYSIMFGSPITDMLINVNEYGPPQLTGITPTIGPIEGGIEICILGHNFDKRRRVVCLFHQQAVVAHEVPTGKKALCILPSYEMDYHKANIVVDVVDISGASSVADDAMKSGSTTRNTLANRRPTKKRVGDGYSVDVAYQEDVFVCASNNFGHDWCAHKLLFKYEDRLPRFTLPYDIQSQLQRVYKGYCTFKDPYNSEFLYLDKWRMFKLDFGLKGLTAAFQQKDGEDGDHHGLGHEERDSGSESGDGNTSENIEFFKFAEVHKGSNGQDFSLTFKDFLRAIVYMTILSKDDKHPSDVFAEIVEKKAVVELGHKGIITIEDESNEIALAKEIEMIDRRPYCSLDVYRGPVLCATVEDRPGFINTMLNKNMKGKRHKFLNYIQHDEQSESVILNQVNLAETWNQLLYQLKNAGYDFAASHPQISTRKPIGRCWNIYYETVKIGSMWDYPGQFSSLTWQPRIGELDHPHLAVTIYEDIRNKHFLNCYKAFKSSDTLQKFRNNLEKQAYILRTTLSVR